MYLTAKEAADALGVSVATIYAYVSRGLLRSEATPEDSRARRYRRDDVERLLQRKDVRAAPERSVSAALSWGAPVLESSITLITEESIFYRGRDAIELAWTRSIEEVAEWIWSGAESPDPWRAPPDLPPLPSAPGVVPLGFADRAAVALAVVGASDFGALAATPEALLSAGRRIVQVFVRAAVPDTAWKATIIDTLSAAWSLDSERARIVSAAIVLCADHGLNVSSFSARCAASAGSFPYAIAAAGLASLRGRRHAGTVERILALLHEARRPEDLAAVLAARLRRGDDVAGFGHPLYPDGDPRAHTLLDAIATHESGEPWSHAVRECGRILGAHPSVDAALALIQRAFDLPPEAALELFAIGRAIGWMAHAAEQIDSGELIRPRARYVGAMPGE